MLSRCDNCLLILPAWLRSTQILRLFFLNQSHDVKLQRLLGFCEHPHKRSFHDSTCSKSLARVYNGCHCRRGSYSILKARAPTHSAHFMSLTFFFILSPARMSRSHCRPCWHNGFLWSYWRMYILHVRHSWSSFRLGSHASCHMLKLAGHRPEEKKMLCVNACGGIQRISMCYATDRQACVTCHFVYNQVDCTDVFHHLTTSPIISSCTHTFATP